MERGPGPPPLLEELLPDIAMAQRPSRPQPLSLVRPLLSLLQASLHKAIEHGENMEGFHLACLVYEDNGAQGQRVHSYRPIPFKQLKELKLACAQYGSTAPFTQVMLESLSLEALTPSDWKQLARACLTGGKFLLWKSEFLEQCERTVELNRSQNPPLLMTFEMLSGEGQFHENNMQLEFDPGVNAQVNVAAQRAWYKLPSTGRQTEDLSKIRQGPDEPFQEFVVRLMESARRLIGDTEADMLLAKQLAYENGNSACQAALRPFRKKEDLADYVRLCSDIGPA
ncbi:endogenous retrovirus group K member 10 Gag polyprotein-like [Rousettus aegyptiacus]|uniref:endogenous retrovirus group K member 10 Gag polyprotein-like n=1 Tax=Rousettus aegyptiacus TaxID=9407 RepID=UPI00168D6676|nr:endogenous retrovirus group K member 10 Gag polyprotein-like [Rousettus aegyptiacus]